MSWKAIGNSVIGTSHTAVDKTCEDAIRYEVVNNGKEDILICCASDGAGSAKYAAFAAKFCTEQIVETLSAFAQASSRVGESEVFTLVEDCYFGLEREALTSGDELNEYSCTLLGCYLTPTRSVFFQIGDGAIIRNDGNGYYTHCWWPENGEYQNTTSFLVDDSSFSNLNVSILDERVDEVAMFTDGLQMLALNMEARQVHQPFFIDLFKFLRQANDAEKVTILNRKLAEYLDSAQINSRTDDDKTLFMATRLG